MKKGKGKTQPKKGIIGNKNEIPDLDVSPNNQSEEDKFLNLPGKTVASEVVENFIAKNDFTTNKVADDNCSSTSVKPNNPTATSISGRAQRIRKKPKRWDDEQVEVDFSGRSHLFGHSDESKNKKMEDGRKEESVRKRQKVQPKSAKSVRNLANEKSIEDETNSSFDENDDSSNFDSDDDPQKLWCICRKPYDRRFMINCDSCDEWFHGKCVNVTKVQGRRMEKLKQEWFCHSCQEGIDKNISREDLKKEAESKRNQLEEKERLARLSQRNKSAKIKKTINKKESSNDEESKSEENQSIKDESSDHSNTEVLKSVKKKLDKHSKSPKENVRKDSTVREDEEKKRLKKLIKASKKDLNEKQKLHKIKEEKCEIYNLAEQESQSEKDVNDDNHSLNPVNNSGDDLIIQGSVVLVPHTKPKVELTSKKKHKSNPVDQSVSDLFKAEPVLVRSLSSSSASPTSATSDNNRKTSEPRRTSFSCSNISLPSPVNGNEISCPACFGKVFKEDAITENNSIYCNNNCLQTHVSDILKLLRLQKKQKEKSNPVEQQKPLRAVLLNRFTGKLLWGKDALLEKDVLSYIMKNPIYEVVKPNNLHNFKNQMVTNSPNSPKIVTSKTISVKESKNEIETKKNSTNQYSSQNKLERSSSVSEKPDDRRKYVCKQMREIFDTRFNELNSNEKLKTSHELISKLAKKIEAELFKAFKCNSQKYNSKSRSLIFNLKDQKNTLYRKVLLGKITPERLVSMSPEQLASVELARWRENEKKTTLELIKRDAVDQANQVIVKKTHKGEEFITDNDIISELPSALDVPNKSDSSKGIFATSITKDVQTDISEPKAEIVQNSSEAVVSCLNILDTTSQHKSHVYSNNCKICMGGSEADDLKLPTKKDSSASPPAALHSSTTSSQNEINGRPQPKRVRVELESTSKFLEQVVKLSDKLLLENKQATSNNSKTESVLSPVAAVESSKISLTEKKPDSKRHKDGPTKAIWKGTIFMQDVAKFVATAHNISGNITNNLLQDINEQITVCGRITPEQVSDYISKLKSSKRTDIGIVEFTWVTREERTGYDAFFNYLHVRGRYGVVGNSGKAFKDFYILPLAQNQEIPKILHPIDGSGITKRLHRPNLLLGILIRTRKSSPTHTTPISITPKLAQSSRQTTNVTRPDRSYTPPLSNCDTSFADDPNSYTPPRVPPSKRQNDMSLGNLDKVSKIVKYDNSAGADPEIKSAKSSAYINNITKQIASSTNSSDVITSGLSTISTADNHNLKKLAPNSFSEKAENQHVQLEGQKLDTNEKVASGGVTTALPNLSLGNVFCNIKNIQIPDNIKDILNSVQKKAGNVETEQTNLGGSSGNEFSDYRSTTSINDPRLRGKNYNSISAQSDRTDPPATLPASQPVTSMSQDELLRKAQEQMAALAQMEHSSFQQASNAAFIGNGSRSDIDLRNEVPPLTHIKPINTPTMPKISFQWKKKK